MEIKNQKKINNIKKIRQYSYLGNKYRLFDWIKENLPEGIEDMNVLDAFGGSGNVSINMFNIGIANVTYNDFDLIVFKLFKYVNDTNKTNIINDLKANGLLVKDDVVFANEYKIKSDIYLKQKKLFNLHKESMNENKCENAEGWELLHHISSNFKTNFNKNSKGELNQTFGKTCLKEKQINNWKQFPKIKKLNKDFEDINFNDYDFLYLDPPYFETSKTNDYGNLGKNNFNEKLKQKILSFNGKFMLSNYHSEDWEHWAKENNYRIERKEQTKTVGGKAKLTVEILIMNY